MNVEQVREYCLSHNKVTEDFPFDEVNLVFRICDKIFACLPLDKPEMLVLKCDAGYAQELRASYPAIEGAFHWNKKYWSQLVITELDDSLVTHLIDHAYSEVVKKLPRRLRDTL